MIDVFANRSSAGRLLARELLARRFTDPVVLALPRGGVPVAAEVAQALQAPLDLVLVRKIGAPGHRELAVAAIAEGETPEGELVLDHETLDITGATQEYVQREAGLERGEIQRRRALYLQGRAPLAVEGRTAIVVDDGIATGTTMRAALQSLRKRKPARLVLAVPVAPPEAIEALRHEVDEVVCLAQPAFFGAVGSHYADFHQVPDDEVIATLAQAIRAAAAPAGDARAARRPTGETHP